MTAFCKGKENVSTKIAVSTFFFFPPCTGYRTDFYIATSLLLESASERTVLLFLFFSYVCLHEERGCVQHAIVSCST